MAANESECPFVTRSILGVKVAVSNYGEVVERSLSWAREGRSRALYFAAVHMLMESADNPVFLPQLEAAGTIFPDGMPLAWALRALGERDAHRVCGSDVMALLLAAAEKAEVSVGFYGGSQSTLDSLVNVVRLRYPNINIAYAESPPFRALTPRKTRLALSALPPPGRASCSSVLAAPSRRTGWRSTRARFRL